MSRSDKYQQLRFQLHCNTGELISETDIIITKKCNNIFIKSNSANLLTAIHIGQMHSTGVR